jgi:Cof subfamily protein (haloacid dehalogenase superfamily)
MHKVVFFDVDGTLLSEVDRSIKESTREAISCLINKGIKVVVATGRPYSMCEQFKELGIDIFISANGAYIKSNDEVIYKSVLSKNTVTHLSEFAHANGNALSYLTSSFKMNGLGTNDPQVMHALNETLNIRSYPETITSLVEEIYCICLYAGEEETKKFMEKFPYLKFERFHSYVTNVLEQEVSKLTAVKQVLTYLNFDKSEVIAFGDGENDISMLEYVGLGIAMGNSGDNLKRKSHFVTRNSSDDGIYYALKKLQII